MKAWSFDGMLTQVPHYIYSFTIPSWFHLPKNVVWWMQVSKEFFKQIFISLVMKKHMPSELQMFWVWCKPWSLRLKKHKYKTLWNRCFSNPYSKNRTKFREYNYDNNGVWLIITSLYSFPLISCWAHNILVTVANNLVWTEPNREPAA